MKRPRLLLADNMEDYRLSARSLLELHEYDIVEASSVDEARQILESQHIDLVLTDQRLTNDEDPHDLSGLRLARIASERKVPCVMTTAYASVDTIRMALRRAGGEPLAEDVVRKTEGPHALLAAVKSALQRVQDEEEATGGDLVVDLQLRLVWLKGEALRVSRYQYALLAHLYENAGAVCSPKELFKAVYGEVLTPEQASADRRLESLVERLRVKIGDDPGRPRYIVKEPMRGYRLVLNP